MGYLCNIPVVYLLQDVLFLETGSTLKLLHHNEAQLPSPRTHELFHAVPFKLFRVTVPPVDFYVCSSRGGNKLSRPLADWRVSFEGARGGTRTRGGMACGANWCEFALELA
jgi:hypothetical protein